MPAQLEMMDYIFVLQGAYDLVILDRMLPGMDGISLLRRLRREGGAVPVILLTALGELEHKIEGLDAGADDYIVKPFAFEELMARIRSIGRPQSWEQHETYTVGDLRLEPREKRLEGPGGVCSLSKREADLLEFFLKNPGQTLPERLCSSEYGDRMPRLRMGTSTTIFIFCVAGCVLWAAP